MRERSYRPEFISSEEMDLHAFRGKSLKEVIEFLEEKNGNNDQEGDIGEKEWKEHLDKKGKSIFDGFLSLLREKGVRVSTPEWLQFLQVVSEKTKPEQLKEMVNTNELLNKVRLFAQTTLVKDKAEESAFHEAFNEYFESTAKVFNRELKNKELEKDKKNEIEKSKVQEKESGVIESEAEKPLNIEKIDEKLNLFEEQKLEDKSEKPAIKDHLGIKEIAKDLNLSENTEHSGEEKVHGGKKDQHNDILRQADESKIGGGKGKTEKVMTDIAKAIIYKGEGISKQDIQEREKKVGKLDQRNRYEERPDKASMREVVRNVRRIIMDVSDVKSRNVDLKRTVDNFAKRNFRFEYEREREKQPEIVLFIDIGGPVDEWSPLIKEVAESMSEGLTKLEVYLFHNNLYGYVWKPDQKDLLKSRFAKPDSLIDIKSIIKKRKKVIIYGDAEMQDYEFENDNYEPNGNEERIKKFGMGGEKCLNFIKKKSDSVVWINPVFQKDWKKNDDSGITREIGEIISMYDLTIGGVEDAVKDLMKK